jgi:hypothetical protein
LSRREERRNGGGDKIRGEEEKRNGEGGEKRGGEGRENRKVACSM